jgi:hypothetical protein
VSEHASEEEFRMKNLVTVVGLCVGALVVMEQAALADPTKKDDDYGYIFKDDALQAEGKDAITAQIRVRQRGTREGLLRPRVHFVPEMLKSVENL